MKNYTLTFLTFFLAIILLACKKEKSPSLEITVRDSDNQVVSNIWVRTSVPGADFRSVDSRVIDSVRTDGFGKAFFEFDNTVLLRVDAYQNPSEILDSISVLLETKRLRPKEDNDYERSMRIP